MPLTVCFDALGTCFTVEVLVDAMEELLGDELRKAGQGPRMVVSDWFHSAQRDFTYLSITSPPPPPIAQILTLTLPRSLNYALSRSKALATLPAPTPLPDLTPITSRLKSLTPAPTLSSAFHHLKDNGANVLVVTNGGKATTEGYARAAGLASLVDAVVSCDDVGLAKPFAQVYSRANEACAKVEIKAGEKGGDPAGIKHDRWFVAAHGWDVAAARKAGFMTGLVLAEQPPTGSMPDGTSQEDAYWSMLGGKPDVTGRDLEEVVREIVGRS